MRIETLQVQNVRNLARVELNAHPRLNYLFGENGAGKTSLLEALSILSRGRSFRTNQAMELLGPDGRTFRVFATARLRNGTEHRMGLERSGSHWRGRLDGQDVAQLSQLTRMMPLVVMEPDSHLLVSGAPEHRRRYLDWGMFHVEPEFLDTARRFNKSLKQRNAALRRGNIGVLESIDEVFAEWGGALSVMRERHCARIDSGMGALMSALSRSVKAVTLNYLPGWKGGTLRECLAERRERDLDRGASSDGPHRAEMELLCDKKPVRSVFSRGEQKVLSAALLFSQARLLSSEGDRPVLLLDDLASEFDEEHFARVLNEAFESGCQVWLTGTSEPPEGNDRKVFHVEQGTIRELV